MYLNEVGIVLNKSAARLTIQSDFVADLQSKLDSGQTKISTYVAGVWTEVNLADFLAAAKSTLAGYTAYDNGLKGVAESLQSQLNDFVKQAGEFVEVVPSQTL